MYFMLWATGWETYVHSGLAEKCLKVLWRSTTRLYASITIAPLQALIKFAYYYS